MGIGDDLATTRVGVAENNLDGLLLVRNLFLREIAYEDRFSRHGYSLRLFGLLQPISLRAIRLS
jgi:hypothetical protein